jgi:Rap1a immunity proteins
MKKLLLITLAVTTSMAQAEYLSGNDLLTRLNSEGIADRGFALGYIAGVSDGLEDILVCAPTGSTTGQARDIVWQYLRINPQSRHQGAALLVVEALQRVWPCRQKGKAL